MTDDELRRRLAGPEDNFTERKPEGVNRAAVRRTLVAFANSVPPGTEAVLFIGVSNKGTPAGVKDPDGLQKTIIRPAAEDCYPSVEFTVHVIDVNGASIVAVVVGRSDARPHFSGPAYVRKGSESVAASRELYEELIASRHTTAGTILRHKGQAVTIFARRPLGMLALTGDSKYLVRHEGVIVDCTPHVVTVGLTEGGIPRTYPEPLDKVRILAENPLTLEINE